MERGIILSAALLLFGCVSEPIAYDDNKRILITGKVNYQGPVPIANTPVGAYIATGGPDVHIGQGTIGEDGVFKVVALSPKDAINVHLEVNYEFLEGYQEGITSYEVNGLHLSEQPDNTYVLPDLVMQEVIQAKIEAVRKINMTDTLYVTHVLADIEGDTQVLGKPQGSDIAANKATYPALLGMLGAKEKAQNLIQQAHEALANIDADTTLLASLADYLIERDH